MATAVVGVSIGFIVQLPRRPPPAEMRDTQAFNMDYVPGMPAQQDLAPRHNPFSRPQPGASVLPAQPVQPRLTPTLPPAEQKAVDSRPRVRADGRFTSLIKNPAKFIVKGTYFGSPKALKGFLADPKKVKAYVEHPIVREVLDSRILMKVMLRPSIAKAFVASPAMQDRAAVSALARSQLLVHIAKSPGVQAALQDQAVVNKVLLDKDVIRWLSKHPEAVEGLSKLSPSLAALATGIR